MSSFKAVVIDKTDVGQTVALSDFDENDLMDGDVTVCVEYSTVNYKDGLAITGKDESRVLSPAQRLGLMGTARAEASKCLADAIYFEARGDVM